VCEAHPPKREWQRPRKSHDSDMLILLVRKGPNLRRAEPSGTICLTTSHLRRHSRFSDNDSRPFCFPVPTETLSYDSCATFTILHYCLDTCSPCYNSHCLGHDKMFLIMVMMTILMMKPQLGQGSYQRAGGASRRAVGKHPSTLYGKKGTNTPLNGG